MGEIIFATMQTMVGTDFLLTNELLVKGELVAIPTETVYGLAANALDRAAVVKIFEAKNRPSFNPLIVHCASWQKAQDYVINVPEKAHLLAEKFMPGPLTLLLDKKNIVPDIVTAGSSKVAVRVPNHPIAAKVLQELDFPLAAPSANPFGYISPTTAAHVMQSLAGKIPYILDGGPSAVGLESTIVGFGEQEEIILYRSGGISMEELEKVSGEKVLIANTISEKSPETSGRLKSHYAPNTALYVGDIERLQQQFTTERIAVISFTKEYDGVEDKYQFILSPTGNLQEAASNLFAALREIDKLDATVILAEYFPDQGIGRAINDRLSRAKAENKN